MDLNWMDKGIEYVYSLFEYPKCVDTPRRFIFHKFIATDQRSEEDKFSWQWTQIEWIKEGYV